MVPKPVADLEELTQHCSAAAPRMDVQPCNLRQHNVVVGQNPAPPEMEEE
jgi:hypothetical protein